MARRRTLTLLSAVLAMLLIGAICAVLLPSRTDAGKPPAPVNSLTLTSPTASTFVLDRGQQLTVSWRIASPLRTGFFCVYDCTTRDGVDHALRRVEATADTSYSTTFSVDGETFFEGGYRHIAVKYRTGPSADFTLVGSSPELLIDRDPMPFMTWPWGAPLTILVSDPVSIPLAVTHTAPAPAIDSAVMTLFNVSTGVRSNLTLTTALVTPYWTVSTSWPRAATMRLSFPPNSFAPGNYQWHVTVTTAGGESNDCAVVGFLTVKAPTKSRH